MSNQHEQIFLQPFDLGAAKTAPSRILVSPWGLVRSKGEGGDYLLDAEASKQILARFADHGVDLPVDLEHQTLGGKFRSPDGGAPAVGWIKALEPIEGDGLYASVEWTDRGRELIESRSYRYLSPVTGVRTRDNRMVVLHSVALTNKPGIMGMRPIANKQSLVDGDEDHLSDTEVTAMKGIRKVLGLPDDADEAKCVEKIEALKADGGAGELRKSICSAVKLDPEKIENDGAIVTAIHSLHEKQKPDATEYVSATEHSEALKRIGELEAEQLTTRINSTIKDALEAGRICESQREEVEKDLRANFEAASRSIQRVPENTFPGSGRKTAGDVKRKPLDENDRTALIANAAKEFDEADELKQITCKQDFVNDTLRERGKAELSEEETAKLIA